jgi:hypothetical protein
MKLNKKRFKKIKKDAEGTSMLSDGQIAALAEKLNEEINFPIIGENLEEILLAKIIKRIDQKVYELLPNEYYSLVKSVSNGISDEDAENIEARMTPLINEKVNLPFLSEEMEQKIIGFVLNSLINAMRKNFKLDEKRIEE